jgi:tetratricopeptide (TPR) repeat protein
VVVAGWAVDDRAAERFATQLYGDLLAGADFGNAVTQARIAAWSAANSSLTWGAYQCYGDPGFRLAPRAAGRVDARPNTSGDLRRRVQQLNARASDQGRSAATDPAHALAKLRRDLTDLGDCARDLQAWDVSAELAAAWAELLDFDRAIELYQVALARGGSAVRLQAVEQLGNLLIREACRRHRAGREDGVAEHADEAERWLTRAVEIAESGERLALLGSYHKKRATMTAGDDRRHHLAQALAYYDRANDLTAASYHQLNARQLAAIAHFGAPGSGDGAPTAGDEEAAVAPEPARPEKAPDFWSRAARGDGALTALVETVATAEPSEIEPDVEARWREMADEMVERYVSAFRLRSSARERASVVDHLDDLAELVAPDDPLATILREASDRLGAWPAMEGDQSEATTS